MCIRDRYKLDGEYGDNSFSRYGANPGKAKYVSNIGYLTTNGGKGGDAGGRGPDGILYKSSGATAVSYTHLDVYKRQANGPHFLHGLYAVQPA